MDIDRILRNMNKESRELVQANLDAYKKTGNDKYAQEVLDILKNFADTSTIRDLERTLKK